MNLPILGKLKDGERFDFNTLADSAEETDEFWDYWWEGRDLSVIARPQTIIDSDPILTETINKTTVDLYSYSCFFNKFLTTAMQAGKLPCEASIDRIAFRQRVIKMIGANSVVLPDRPRIIFVGGGYGSGKTTIIGHLADQGKIELTRKQMIGVDYFKFYMPEFSLIQSVADGRASSIVQKECKKLADDLCVALIGAGRSFVLDSSMSNRDETLARIRLAQAKGYELSMVAVLTPIEIAIRQAMARAKETRRFPHPVALPDSHTGFRRSFNEYEAIFDEITVFAKVGNPDDIPVVIADKENRGKGLAIHDRELFNQLLSLTDR